MKRSLVKKLSPPVMRLRKDRQTFTRLADILGFVYFGTVSRSMDDQQLVQGLTLSPSSHDKHYTVGSLEGYDISIVQRSDTLKHPGKQKSSHNWTIVQVDLHTTQKIPHIFVGLHSHSETFYAQLFITFPRLNRLPIETHGYPNRFLERYKLYSSLPNLEVVKGIISPSVADKITQHFGTLTAEVDNGYLYIYSERQTVSSNLIHAMVQNAIWLARVVDDYYETRTLK